MHLRRTNLAWLSVVLTVGACTDLTGPAEQLQVTITASAVVARIDEPVIIKVSALNQGNEPVIVRTNPCPEAYRVTNRRGKVVAPGPSVCQLVLMTEVVNPGERLVFSYSWAGTTRERVDAPTVTLPAGQYAVRGIVLAEGAEIRSAPISIEIPQ